MVNDKEISYYNTIKDEFTKYVAIEPKIIDWASRIRKRKRSHCRRERGGPRGAFRSGSEMKKLVR